MKILFTNDDGYNAVGIQTLYKQFSSTYKESYMCAPLRHKSAFSHAINYYDHLELIELSDGVKGFALDSTPADCVRSAMLGLFDFKFDLVLSGINYGVNAAQDIFYSGTIGAAREATFHGVLAIATSLDLQDPTNDQLVDNKVRHNFEYVAKIVERIVNVLPKELLHYRGSVININFPSIVPAKGIKLTTIGDHNYSLYLDHKKENGSHYIHIKSKRHEFPISKEGSDVHHLNQGEITVTAMHRGVVLDEILQSKLDFIHNISIEDN